MKEKRYDILSPDGIGLFREQDFGSPEEAWRGFDKWKQRFNTQGYYASSNGRIALDKLKEHCKLIDYEIM